MEEINLDFRVVEALVPKAFKKMNSIFTSKDDGLNYYLSTKNILRAEFERNDGMWTYEWNHDSESWVEIERNGPMDEDLQEV